MEEIKIHSNDMSDEEFEEFSRRLMDNEIFNQMPSLNEQLKDLSIIEHGRNGKIKFKKPSSHSDNKYKIGKRVSNGSLIGEIIDIDNELLCVKTSFGNIEVWNTGDVKII